MFLTAQPELRRLHGQGRVELSSIGGRTVIERAVATSPLKLLMPRSRGGSAWIFTSTYGGGLLGGDSIGLDVTAGENTRCLLSTQASTKIYRSTGAVSTQQLDVSAGDEAIVISLPDPIVCYDGAKFEQRQRFDLARNSELVMLDWFTSGRRARGERWAFLRYMSRNEIFVEGRCAFRDVMSLNQSDGPLDGTMRMGLLDCFATAVIIGKHSQQLLKWIAAQPAGRRSNVLFGGSPIPGGVVVRVAGNDTESVGHWLRQRLAFIADLIEQDPWSRKF